MQNLKRFFKNSIYIITAVTIAVSICMLNFAYAEYDDDDPDETEVSEQTTEETEPDPPEVTTTNRPIVIRPPTTTKTEPPVVTWPPVIETEPPVTETEPSVTEIEPPEETDDTTDQGEEPPVGEEELQLSFNSYTLEKGQGVQLTATVVNSTNPNPTVTFYSQNTAVARVDASGYIIAIGEGETEIVALCDDLIVSAIIWVTDPEIEPEYIILSNSSFTLNIGGIAKIEAQLLPEEIANNYDFEYSSSNTSVVEVSKDGIITAIGEGEAEITVSAAELSETVYVKVTSEIDFETSKIDGYLYNDLGEPMAGSIVNIDGQSATVDKNGHFSFDKVNQKSVTIYISDDPEATCTYTVLNDATVYLLSQENALVMLSTLGELQGRLPISSVTFDSANIILSEGEVYSLNYTYQPKDASITQISYESSNSLVAQVGQIDGIVTAKSAGVAIITLTVNGGQASVALSITVNPQESTKYSPLIVVLEGLLFIGAAVVIVTYYKKYQKTVQMDYTDEDDIESDLHDID